MKLEVVQRRALTPEIEEFTLRALDGAPLPAAEPGAHVTLQTPSGAMRRYSLVQPSESPDCYVLAIKREPASRGGSQSMHASATAGRVLQVDPPVTEFPLGRGHRALLIAGGIGITPIYSMARRLVDEGREFRLIYCTRDAAHSAYAEALRTLCDDRLVLHHDGGDPDRAFDFWTTLGTPSDEHIYCCGPAPLMEEIKGMTGHWPEGQVHFEDFKPVEVVRKDDQGFAVTLKRSQATIQVPADRSILEALRDAGHQTVSSCESGTCGTCKCTLVAGEVDHRDMVLMDDEKAGKIMICVSRAKGDHLVLDL